MEKKIKKHGISGSRGSGSLEDHQKLGGDVIKDIACQYLAFLENDVNKYNDIIDKFSKGQISCGETKKLMLERVDDLFKIGRDNSINNEYIKNYSFIKET